MRKITKISNVLRVILITFLGYYPVTAIYAQPFLATSKINTATQSAQSSNFAKTSLLQDNLFRWDAEYLQTLRNQEVMNTQQAPLHLTMSLNEVNRHLTPKVHLKCHIDNQSTSFKDILLELGYIALDVWYDRWQWSATPTPAPDCGGSGLNTNFINCPLK